jgi:uncharacterized protein
MSAPPEQPAPDELPVTPRTKLRRHAERGRFDRTTVNEVLDEAYIAHVGFVVDGEPRVLPMTYGRDGDVLYLHGAAGNAMLRASVDSPVCVTVTLLDGLVLARSAFHHSMNFRSVVLLGMATKVTDDAEKRHAFDVIVDHVVPGRSQVARPSNDVEGRATMVLRLPIQEGSAKVRTGGPIDDPEDMDLPVWAGVVPLRLTPGEPEQDPAQAPGALAPPPPASFDRTYAPPS